MTKFENLVVELAAQYYSLGHSGQTVFDVQGFAQALVEKLQPQTTLAGWCYPEGGRTRFADPGDTVDRTFAHKMRAVYYKDPPSEFAVEVAKIAKVPTVYKVLKDGDWITVLKDHYDAWPGKKMRMDNL